MTPESAPKSWCRLVDAVSGSVSTPLAEPSGLLPIKPGLKLTDLPISNNRRTGTPSSVSKSLGPGLIRTSGSVRALGDTFDRGSPLVPDTLRDASGMLAGVFLTGEADRPIGAPAEDNVGLGFTPAVGDRILMLELRFKFRTLST